MWVKLLTVPYYVLFPTIMAFCSIGVYSVNSNVYDLYVVAFFGLLGYFLLKLRCEPAPLLLGFVLGPLLEENLRRAMILSRGDPTTFVTRPFSAGLLVVAAARSGRGAAAKRAQEARRGFRRGRMSPWALRQQSRAACVFANGCDIAFRHADVAKLVDARDLKSLDLWSYGFDPRRPHQVLP